MSPATTAQAARRFHNAATPSAAQNDDRAMKTVHEALSCAMILFLI